MGCSGLLILGLVLSVAHCLESLGSGEPILEITTKNITAAVGEDVYLGCRYLGQGDIQSAVWKRRINSRVKSKALAGFFNDQRFAHYGFSEPDSVSNLTVRMSVTKVSQEGEYICEVVSEMEYSESVFLTVLARPDIQTSVSEETVDGSHFQSVRCSAVGGRPAAQISWLVGGLPPSDDDLFTVERRENVHLNGTSSLSSTLRFPTRLQDEDSVTCVTRHPTLPTPERTTVRVQTYMRPNVTIKAEMGQDDGGREFWVVSCVSSGGRPDTDISLALSTHEELQIETDLDSDTQTSSIRLPVTAYEGQNVTCTFDHPKFTHTESCVITLPSFYFSGVQLFYSEPGRESEVLQETESLELQEGQSDTVVGLRVTGNVPRYNVTCEKDEGPLPEDVKLVGSNVTLQGAVGLHHAGLYECFFSYHHLQATLRFNITVIPQVTLSVPPRIQVDLRTADGQRVIKCSAADAVPAANMSWLLPEGVSGPSWFSFTSHNGSHSVGGVLLLPACWPRELTVECVINHPAFERPESRPISLPLCARPNITIDSSAEWKDGVEYTKVHCSVSSVALAATISWRVGNTNISSGHASQTEVLMMTDGLVSARSTVLFSSLSLYRGQNLTCTVEHPSLEAPEERTIRIPVCEDPLLNVSVERQQDSPLWVATCECRGDCGGTNLTWVLPERAKVQTALRTKHAGRVREARLTYQFPLAPYEGQNLTCVLHFQHGGAPKKRTVHIPRYHISSVRVLNHTTPLQSRHGGGQHVVHRLTLQEHRPDQIILLRVEGTVPEYNLDCRRSDGSFVQTEQSAMVFRSEVTERNEGVYTCRASFYHHSATVHIQVEVMSRNKLFAMVAMICVSSAVAVLLTVGVLLWVCCKGNSQTKSKKRGSLAALTGLMHEPGSPEVKKTPATEKDGQENAQLISYSIVFDAKSTV